MSKEPSKKANGGRDALLLPRSACHLAESKRNAWELELPAGATPEDLLNLDALGPLARELSIKDLLFAQPRDGAWLGIYRVIDATVNRAQLALLLKVDLPARVESDEADPPGFRISRDDVLGWHAIRVSDGVLMGSQRDNPDLRNREMTRRYVHDHATVRSPRGN